jgi:hypothetical protein
MRCKLNPDPDQHGMGKFAGHPAVDWRMARMFVCETCGNKRCPHANDHRNDCTGSNEPGQPGSRYP